MTNKSIAHITLDEWKATYDDLHDVFIAVSTIACAIQSIMGKLACPVELAVTESMAREATVRNRPPKYKEGYIPMIQAFLPSLVNENLTSSSS